MLFALAAVGLLDGFRGAEGIQTLVQRQRTVATKPTSTSTAAAASATATSSDATLRAWVEQRVRGRWVKPPLKEQATTHTTNEQINCEV
jgi:hypothetical protein